FRKSDHTRRTSICTSIFNVNLPAGRRRAAVLLNLSAASGDQPKYRSHHKGGPCPSYGSVDRATSARGPGPERPSQGGGASRAIKRFFVIAVTSRAHGPRA